MPGPRQLTDIYLLTLAVDARAHDWSRSSKSVSLVAVRRAREEHLAAI